MCRHLTLEQFSFCLSFCHLLYVEAPGRGQWWCLYIYSVPGFLPLNPYRYAEWLILSLFTLSISHSICCLFFVWGIHGDLRIFILVTVPAFRFLGVLNVFSVIALFVWALSLVLVSTQCSDPFFGPDLCVSSHRPLFPRRFLESTLFYFCYANSCDIYICCFFDGSCFVLSSFALSHFYALKCWLLFHLILNSFGKHTYLHSNVRQKSNRLLAVYSY